MKIVLLTPGVGNFHCGSCLHDETLAKALRGFGHDAVIVPLYLPLVLDRADLAVNSDRVQMGGINLYLQQKSTVFRHTPAFIDRLLDMPGLLHKAANRAGMTHPEDLGRMTVEMLRGRHGKTAKELDRLIEHLQEKHPPDVVVLNNALLMSLAGPIRDRLGCPIACTLHGEDTFLDGLPDPWREQAWSMLTAAGQDIDVYLPVSQYHRDVMIHRLGLQADRVQVVHNGIETNNYTTPETPPDPPTVGYLARLCKAKGLETLISAYIYLRQMKGHEATRLLVVGTANPSDKSFVRAIKQQLQNADLADYAEIRTNVTFEEKLACLKQMSLLSVPATYGESFGLYLIEAMAAGVPVVQPRHAAFPEILGLAPGGVLCRPDDPVDLARVIDETLSDESRRAALIEAGRGGVLEHFTATRMARRTVDALEPICHAASA